MNFLLDPNVAYLILVLGVILGMLALFTPGTGILEIGAIFAIFLAGYAMYNLPIRLWALILLAVGVVPFIFALRKFKQWYWLVPAIVSAVVGSVFLFRSDTSLTAINPFFATLVSIISIVFMWLIGIKVSKRCVCAHRRTSAVLLTKLARPVPTSSTKEQSMWAVRIGQLAAKRKSLLVAW